MGKYTTAKGLTLLVVLLFSAGAAMGFEIAWYTVDGGGGTSSGGSFEMSGTAGQPDAGAMGGESYVLTGGYWEGTPLCVVDMLQFVELASLWLSVDLNEDTLFDINDLIYFSSFWLTPCPANWGL